jgi:hypothetical protein
MSKIGDVERRIRRIEGFTAQFLYLDGTDVRSDKTGLPQYHYDRAASHDITVEAWKTARFKKAFPGYDVRVLDGRHNVVQGNTRLGTVRRSYKR